jgi:hypothetical protein
MVRAIYRSRASRARPAACGPDPGVGAAWLTSSPSVAGTREPSPPTTPQERLTAELSARSVGAAYVFKPDHYRRGQSGIREPVDLVWATNGVVVLMSMKGGRDKPQARAKSMRQLGGVLRAWRGGQSLRGRNATTEFVLEFDPEVPVVLLSVLEGATVPLAVHADEARRLAVAMVATVPQDVLEKLAHMGGGSRDLIAALRRVPDGSLRRDQALDLVEEVRDAAYWQSPVGAAPAYRESPLTSYIWRLLLSMREAFVAARPEAAARRTPTALAADITPTIDDVGWRGLYSVLGTIYSPLSATAPRLILPPQSVEDLQADILGFSRVARASGASIVVPSTLAPIPPDVGAWPPAQNEGAYVLHVDDHVLLVGRSTGPGGPPFLREWHAGWSRASREASPGFPPLSVVLYTPDCGMGLMIAGVTGARTGSATRAVVSSAGVR